MSLHDRSGKLLVNSKHTLRRWGGFFQEILNTVSLMDQDTLDQIHIPTLTPSEEHRQNAQSSMKEIRQAVNQVKSRKAPGSDDVTINTLKAGGEPVMQWLFKFFTGL